ncbi:MAG: DUF4349 domain-containing protein [Bacteroidetes bacterium]|nr:DUF4349 domain-containing protein [Bacteroidota bacterium]
MNFLKTLILLSLTLVLFSCASSKQSSAYSYGDNSGNSKVSAGLSENSDKDVKNNKKSPERMILYNASLTITAKKPDTVSKKVIDIAKKYEGYMLNSGTYSTTIRVKADKLKMAMADIELLGKVKSRNIYTEDVSIEYKDLAIRLDNAQKARTRYLELLQKSANVDEALKVEKELERLNTEIDLLNGKITRYDHLEEFSTISIYVQKRKQPGPLGYVFIGLYKVVKLLFVIN